MSARDFSKTDGDNREGGAESGELFPEGNFVAGAWSCEGSPVELRSRYDGRLVGRSHAASAAALERAIAAAADAQRELAAMSRSERRAIIERAARMLEDDQVAAPLARQIALESGKPISYARIEVARAVDTLRASADACAHLAGDEIPIDAATAGAGRLAFTRRFPAGAIASIAPFNFPLNLVAHKIAPAIAAGCANVVKPASSTPGPALALARLFERAGLPSGALSVVACDRRVGQQLVEDPRLRVLTFTGSAEVGWRMKAEAGKKRVILELGGNAAAIVMPDADVEHAAKRCAVGGYYQAGQSCISVQRVIAHAHVYDRMRDALAAEAQKTRFGDPLDDGTVCGPLIDEGNAERVDDWIDEALAKGGRAIVRRERDGALVPPALLEGVPPECKVVAEEVFGPVIVLQRANDEDEAIAMAGETRFGLQCGIFTNDVRIVLKAWSRIEVGGIVHNDAPAFRVDLMPYGGVRDSGLGREGPKYTVEELTEPRLLVLDAR